MAPEFYERLQSPTESGHFRLGPELSPGCIVAKTHAGHAAILIDAIPTGTSNPRRLERLAYEPPRLLEIIGEQQRTTKRFASLVCLSDDVSLVEAFWRIVSCTFECDTAQITEDQLETRIDELIDLFRALERPGNTTVQGLWAELAVISWSRNPARALAAWHSNPNALHDFAAGADRLEVKSCGTGLREHELRLEQLSELPGGRTLLASVVLERNERGENVADLVQDILVRCQHVSEHRRKLESLVLRSLGSGWHEASDVRFDSARARSSLKLYQARAIPNFAHPIPPEIKQVRFRVDLSNIPDESTSALCDLGPLFREISPVVDGAE